MSTPLDHLPFTPQTGPPVTYKPSTPSDLPPQHVPQNTLPHVMDKESIPSNLPVLTPAPVNEPPTVHWSEEYKLPLLAVIAYFMFSMDGVHGTLKTALPAAFVPGTVGSLSYSLCFGVFFYVLSVGLEMMLA